MRIRECKMSATNPLREREGNASLSESGVRVSSRRERCIVA